MIAIDLTESTGNTKVPVELLSIAVICEGLEALTGADMLISPIDRPPLTSVNSKIGQVSLKKHLESGAILVQRKSGADIVNFIKDHDQILAKMLKFTDQPWLLTTGAYHCDRDDKLSIDGRLVGGSEGWSYWSYWGAIRSWQLRGGYVDNIARDSLMSDWYKRTLKSLNPEPVVYAMPRKPSQQIIIDAEDESGEAYERVACITALATIDNVGIAKAAGIADFCGNLAHALVFLSDHRNLKYDKKESFPKGIGSKIFSNASRWLGLKTGGEGEDQWYETIVIDTVYPMKDE